MKRKMMIRPYLGLVVVLSFAWSSLAFSSVVGAWKAYQNNSRSYLRVAAELMGANLNFAAVPFLKEYLITTARPGKAFDLLLERSILAVGIKQYEILSAEILSKSNAPSIHYILAKKLVRQKKYEAALRELGKAISEEQAVAPFAKMLLASIYSLQRKTDLAVATYRDCVYLSERHLRKVKNPVLVRQLKINRDYCVIGIPRTQFAAGKFAEAESNYLDLPKDSYVWPEILFEEAWNSFYKRDYNRTLGKLVTYKAPVMDFIFNPEAEILNAFAYMELCLWSDVNDAVEDFYQTYQNDARSIENFVNHNRDYRIYYNIAQKSKQGVLQLNPLLDRMLLSIVRDPAYQEMDAAFWRGRDEIHRVENITNGMRRVLGLNLTQSLTVQRNMLGAYVRRSILNYLREIRQGLEGMSYIKLEVLARKRADLLSGQKFVERGRGDVRYLKRNSKQYFWTFNGEFWADELGDYVFALSSECH